MRIVYSLLLIFYSTVFAANEKLEDANVDDVTISEQLDPRYFMRQGTTYPFTQLGAATPYQFQSAAYDSIPQKINFDFRCRCNAKIDRETASQSEVQSSDASPELQKQIKQLQEQVKKQAAQLRRQQQIALQRSGFEQIAALLTISDGLDCSCSGTIPNYNTNQQHQSMLQQQEYGPQPTLHQNMAGVQLTSPFNTPLIPLQPFPLFP